MNEDNKGSRSNVTLLPENRILFAQPWSSPTELVHRYC